MRKTLISLLSLLVLLTSSSALAAELVAAIIPGDLPRYRQAQDAFEAIVRSGGYDESKVKIFAQAPHIDKMSLTNSIRRSVAAGAGLLVTYGAPATLVAMQEAKGIPVLFVDVYDPVALGIVQTLSSPGANRSGVSSLFPIAPLLEALQQIVPNGKRLGAIYSEAEAGSIRQVETLVVAAGRLGLSVVKAEASEAPEVATALASLDTKVDVLFLSENLILSQQFNEILAFANSRHLPVVSLTPGQADAGALLTLSADPAEQGKLVAVHALQILAGQKAFTLPVREAKKITLTANLKAADALSLSIPEATLALAGRVIR